MGLRGNSLILLWSEIMAFFFWSSWGTPWKASGRIPGFLAVIRIGHILNSISKRCWLGQIVRWHSFRRSWIGVFFAYTAYVSVCTRVSARCVRTYVRECTYVCICYIRLYIVSTCVYACMWVLLFLKTWMFYFILFHDVFRPASWSSGQGLWLLIMRSQVRFPVLPWEFFLAGKDSRGDHGLGSY